MALGKNDLNVQILLLAESLRIVSKWSPMCNFYHLDVVTSPQTETKVFPETPTDRVTFFYAFFYKTA